MGVAGSPSVEVAALPARRTEHREVQQTCLVVMYHYVHPHVEHSAGGVHAVSPRDFEEHLRRLCARYEPLGWPHFLAWLERRERLPRAAFLLTFDDGLADHVHHVLPVLERFGVRGTFFVPASVLVQPEMLDAHAVHLLLSELGSERMWEEILRGVHDRTGATPKDDPDEDRAALSTYSYETPTRARLKYLLHMRLEGSISHQIVHELFERHVGSSAEWAQKWYLGWPELHALATSGHTIGGHGFDHVPLGRLSRAARRHDVQQCAAVLNEGLGHDVRPFSFPFGSFDADVREAVREAGFVQAFTTRAETVDRFADPMCLPRVDAARLDGILGGSTGRSAR
jgi:peptidoglycan/xylan/chitin deacetylase (PgdA/CDA1 family)